MTTEIEEKDLRLKVWRIINLTQANQLFVHHKNIDIKYFNQDSETVKSRKLPEILTLCVLNAIVPNSAMLLIGGHGGGKTTLVKLLGRMFTSHSLNEIENSIIRGHPQLTEEKLVGTLKLGKLMHEGKEEVVWRDFIESFWKIIDEVNRLTPYAQDILLSLLAEGTVKYYDSITQISDFCLYATINPEDVGTFELSGPFLDRFGVSVPISMPASHDLKQILSGKDEKYLGYDELIQVPRILKINDLKEIWYHVDKIKFPSNVSDYIHAIIREYTLCNRIDKGNTDDLKPSTGLCSGCHFNTDQNVCNKIDTILSVRVAKDLLRYSKALTWLLGLDKVDLNIVNSVAPYVISHRVEYTDRELNKSPYWGNKYALSTELLKSITKRFREREKYYKIADRFRKGEANFSEIQTLNKVKKNDLIVKLDLIPFVRSIKDKQYKKVAQQIKNASEKGEKEKLIEIRDELMEDLEFPNREDLINLCNREIYKQTLSNYNFEYQYWDYIWGFIVAEFEDIDKDLKDEFIKRNKKQIRTNDLSIIEINITGTKDDSLVNIEVSGGHDARKLIKYLDQQDYIKEPTNR